jgi:hypothetical protein
VTKSYWGGDLLRELGIEPKSALDALIVTRRQLKDEEEITDNSLTQTISDNDDIDDVQIAHCSDNEVEEGLRQLINSAAKNGLPDEWKNKLSKLVLKYKDVWRTSLGPDPPATVTPFVTRLKPNATPYRCKGRRYNTDDSNFLKDFIEELLRNGLVEENFNSEWASPVVVVKKSDGSRRMCVDLRAVNALCESTAWPMPFLEAIVSDLASSKCWFKLDAFKGFWMMPLADECCEMFSFMSDRGVYTPRRSIQGALNSATQFQSRMAEVFKPLIKDSLIVWIDDLLGHADSLSKWFRILEETLRLASLCNIKFNLKKCELFTHRAKFCGRIFAPDGVGHDPDRIEALLAIPQPQTARDLQQFLMASQWMSRSIPEYNMKVVSLQDVFERCMRDQPTRRKSVARQVKLLRFGWNPGHALAFEKLKTAIASCVKLAFPRDDMVQCVFTDANEACTAGMVTQIPIEDENKPVHLQRHEPLGFVGHRFNRCEMNWTVAEKEGFAIKDTMHKLDYLLQMKRPFKLFSDHKNLIQIFSPKNVSKPTAQKLQRWALFIQRFRYTIEHIRGDENVWADMMTRWGASPGKSADTQVLVRRVRAMKIPADVRV